MPFGICAAIIGPAADCEVERIDGGRRKGVGVGKNESLRTLHIAGHGSDQDIVRVEERRECVIVAEVTSVQKCLPLMFQSTRPMYMASFDCTGIPYETLPQGSFVTGEDISSAQRMPDRSGSGRYGNSQAAGPWSGRRWSAAGDLRLATGPSSALKSPASAAAVGTNAVLEEGS